MSGGRQSRSNELFVRGNYDKVFSACEQAANSIGKVKQSSKNLGTISVRTPMKMFPPQNPMNLKISVIEQDKGCTILCDSEGFDGTVGLGSAGKVIDSFHKELDKYLG